MRRFELRAATRETAIAAAKKVWGQPGSYEKGTLRAVADVMQMSTGAVYENFASKSELWRAAFGTPPPVDSALTRAAPAMAVVLDRLLDLQRASGFVDAPAWTEAADILSGLRDDRHAD